MTKFPDPLWLFFFYWSPIVVTFPFAAHPPLLFFILARSLDGHTSCLPLCQQAPSSCQPDSPWGYSSPPLSCLIIEGVSSQKHVFFLFLVLRAIPVEKWLIQCLGPPESCSTLLIYVSHVQRALPAGLVLEIDFPPPWWGSPGRDNLSPGLPQRFASSIPHSSLFIAVCSASSFRPRPL